LSAGIGFQTLADANTFGGKNFENTGKKGYNLPMEYMSKNVQETEKIAQKLAEQIVSQEFDVSRQDCDNAVVIDLEGELGAGKTTFTKAFAKALGVEEKLSSPTFVLMRQYELKTDKFKLLVHIDAYRINSGEDLKLLGIEEILADPENIVLIEWAERVKDILPDNKINIHIDHVSENERKFTINL
jgi:tRNA threonylcarbamoyladenosine biosynthesis protein TsaE